MRGYSLRPLFIELLNPWRELELARAPPPPAGATRADPVEFCNIEPFCEPDDLFALLPTPPPALLAAARFAEYSYALVRGFEFDF